MEQHLGQQLGPHSRIVWALRNYGEVPIDFLARLLGWPREQVEENLQALERDNMVTRKDDKVALASHASRG